MHLYIQYSPDSVLRVGKIAVGQGLFSLKILQPHTNLSPRSGHSLTNYVVIPLQSTCYVVLGGEYLALLGSK